MPLAVWLATGTFAAEKMRRFATASVVLSGPFQAQRLLRFHFPIYSWGKPMSSPTLLALKTVSTLNKISFRIGKMTWSSFKGLFSFATSFCRLGYKTFISENLPQKMQKSLFEAPFETGPDQFFSIPSLGPSLSVLSKAKVASVRSESFSPCDYLHLEVLKALFALRF